MREIIGFHAGDSILAPGGSISNMYALIIARHRFFPQHKHQGMRAIKEHLVVYTSTEVTRFSFPDIIYHKSNKLCSITIEGSILRYLLHLIVKGRVIQTVT